MNVLLFFFLELLTIESTSVKTIDVTLLRFIGWRMRFSLPTPIQRLKENIAPKKSQEQAIIFLVEQGWFWIWEWEQRHETNKGTYGKEFDILYILEGYMICCLYENDKKDVEWLDDRSCLHFSTIHTFWVLHLPQNKEIAQTLQGKGIDIRSESAI